MATEFSLVVQPGPCFAVGPILPGARLEVRCTLRAGHAGAHESLQPSGAAATWSDIEQPPAAVLAVLGDLVADLERMYTEQAIDLDQWSAARALVDTWRGVRRCRACGCTDDAACVGDEGPCSWIAQDLCSECRPGKGSAIEVTVKDLKTGESQTATIPLHEVLVITTGDCHIANVADYPTTGTQVYTIKGRGGRS